VEQWLSASGFTRVQAEREVATPTGPRKVLDVVADRFRLQGTEKARVVEAIEVALKRGSGRMTVYPRRGGGRNYDARPVEVLHRPALPRERPALHDPIPSMFSFNSAVGACEACRGFGRVIGVDYGPGHPQRQAHAARRRHQAHPDARLVRVPGRPDAPCRGGRHPARHALVQAHARAAALGDQRHAQLQGTGKWNKQWYGIKRFFEYLESKAYKMHIRVLLSKYRSYTPCETCGGARLKTESLLWRIGTKEDADARWPRPSVHARRACSGRASSWRPCPACACTT
jgi:excinuclease ABC subunit A